MRNLLALSTVLVFLGGCVGGSDSGSGSAISTYEIINGTLVQPASGVSNSTCPNVPPGYVPVANATVSLVYNGQTVITVSTDECGVFSATVNPADYQIVVNAGNTTISIPEDAFDVTDDDVVTIPSNNTISQGYNVLVNKVDLVSGKIYLTVMDSTGKAIIGVPENAVSLKIDGVPVSLSGWAVSSSQEPASVVMVMDASGSMYDDLYDNSGNSVGDKFKFAALAARVVIDGKSPDDEYAFVIFDSNDQVDFINSTFVNNLGIVYRDNYTIATINYPADGFSTDSDILNFALDLYWPESYLYNSTVNSTVYPYYLNYYRWGYSTALIDATYLGVEEVSSRSNLRKFVIAMTDGWENDSWYHNETEVIDAANQGNVTIYTIGIGDNYTVAKDLLESFANSTGGYFFQIDPSSTDDPLSILDPFLAALSNISYQYVADISALSTLTPGNHTLEVEINYLGIAGNATFTLNVQ